MADDVQVHGVRIKTVFHNPFLTWLKEVLGGLVLGSALMGDPRVDVVVRQDAEKRDLYRDGPYKSEGAQIPIDEIADRIRLIGVDEFLSEVN